MERGSRLERVWRGKLNPTRLLMVQVVLVDTAEGAQEIALPCPNAFHHVAMNCSNAIFIAISSSLALTRFMADRFENAPCLWQWVISLPLSSAAIRPRWVHNGDHGVVGQAAKGARMGISSR